MATRTTKTSTVRAKTDKTTAPKVARARKSSVVSEVVTPSYEAIAERAYARFCERGRTHGCDVEDWLAAEQELRAR